MIPVIVVLLCIVPGSTQYHTADENGYSYIQKTDIGSQSFPYGFPDSFPHMPGWPKVININVTAPPVGAALADVNDDGYLEILVGSSDGSFYVWDYEGNDLSGWPKTGLNAICSRPAVGNIDPAYPGLEIVAIGATANVYCWHADGSVVPGWPQSPGLTHRQKSPVIFDVDYDNDLEIIICISSGVWIYNHDGTVYPGWPNVNEGVATPSVADVDNDGIIEICTQSYSELFLWDKDGNLEPGWPVSISNSGTGSAQPVMADLDDDGDLEILHTYYKMPPATPQTYVGVYHHDGTNVQNWPQEFPGGQSFTTPVVADIDNDGDLEIFGGGHCGTPLPDLLARHHTGDAVTGWPVPVGFMECSPAVLDLDLDDNGCREILINDNTLYPYGSLFAHNHDGTLVPGFPLASGASMPNSPSVGDVDADGDLEIAFVAESLVYLWTGPDVEYRPYMVEWGTWFHDNWNTGWFHPQAPQNLSAASFQTSVHLTWDANTEPDLAGYNIYRSEISGPPYVRVNDTLVTGTEYYDAPPVAGQLYYYCVTAQIHAYTESRLSNEVSDSVGVEEQASRRVSTFSISPNPFSKLTQIRYEIRDAGYGIQDFSIQIYDITGRPVKQWNYPTIQQSNCVSWSGTDQANRQLPAGVYFVRLSTPNEDQVISVVLLE